MARRTVSVVVAATALLVGSLGATARAIDPFDAMAVLRPAAAATAPDIAFARLDGREARVQDLRGKAVLLGFFTTW